MNLKCGEQFVNSELLKIAIPKAERKQPLILVVEDDRDNLLCLTYALIFFSCSVIAATDAQTALSIVKDYQPDLILLDIILPGVSGLELVRILKQSNLTKMIPIVAVTALTREKDRDRILTEGCEGYLNKPYLLEELKEILDRFVFNKLSLCLAARVKAPHSCCFG